LKIFTILLIGLSISILTFTTIKADSQHPSLKVWNAETNQLLATYPVEVGDMLRIKFVHSYAKGFVWEDFKIQKDGDFLMTEVAYAVPSYDLRDQTYPKATRTLKDDGIVYIENITDYYSDEEEEFLIRVPYTVPQWLIFNGEKVELSSLASSGTLLRIDSQL
jgi:hypothetical protein